MPGISNSVDRFNGVVTSLAVKVPCVATSIIPITLSGTQTVNGVAVTTGQRVLVTAQANPVENGIYDVNDGAWTRSADFDGNRDVTTDTFLMSARSVGSPVFWRCTSALPITINSSSITFEQFFDPDAPAAANLEAVTAIANTTTYGIDITTGANLLIRNSLNDELVTIGVNNVMTFNGNNQISGFSFINYSGDFTVVDGRAREWGVTGSGHGLYVNSDLGNARVTLRTDQTHLVLDNSTGAGAIEGVRFTDDMTLFIGETSGGNADIAGVGQFWVRDDQTPMFTDGLGVQSELNGGGAGGAGSIAWTYDNTIIAAADPGAGMVRFNTPNPASFQWMVINDADVD